MKLNKANHNGSVSVIIPKGILDRLGWKIGDYVEIITTEDKKVLKIKNMDLKDE